MVARAKSLRDDFFQVLEELLSIYSLIKNGDQKLPRKKEREE